MFIRRGKVVEDPFRLLRREMSHVPEIPSLVLRSFLVQIEVDRLGENLESGGPEKDERR